MQPDASLGIAVNFPSADVRNALLFAMQMGAPSETLKAKFVKRGTETQYFLRSAPTVPLDPATVAVDRDGKPLNSQIIVRRSADETVEVDVAIEMTEVPVDEMPVGNFSPTKATVTLMREEYVKIAGCQEMLYNQERYGLTEELEANGLFDMAFHTLIFYRITDRTVTA